MHGTETRDIAVGEIDLYRELIPGEALLTPWFLPLKPEATHKHLEGMRKA
jgi:hypothetical protein